MYTPANFLGTQQIVCGIHTLGPVGGLSNYMWNSSPLDTFSTYDVALSGLHWVEGLDSLGNVCRDTAVIIVNPLPRVDLGADQYFCGKRYFDLCPGIGPPWGGWPLATFYRYYYDSLSSSFVPFPQGQCNFWIDSTTTIWLDVEDQNGCRAGDTLVLFFNETMALQLTLFPDFGNAEGGVKADVIGGNLL